ncbi:hypothetical protein BM221_004475 [Beauveria bassiana]|uniref:PH domain-containing protein n=1 Tax=Beauveria bassiana TaxID=176275 RepID=A0A2N6NRF3_BEABA|nr:hypothetical protein BM221_004475 [Beauveria bassiana]
MPAGIRSAHGFDTALLEALFWESGKCITVVNLLTGLRHHLSKSASDELDDLCNQLRRLRRAMLGFADLFPLHKEAIHTCLNHLDITLPSVSKTLDDIQRHCHAQYSFADGAWDRLIMDMTTGRRRRLELWDRFELYTDFFENLFSAMIQKSFVNHWAVDTVDRKPKMMSPFIEICKSFNNDQLALIVFINDVDKLPYAVIRTTYESGLPWYECRPLGKIRIMRNETKIHLSRWSYGQDCFVHWGVFHFRFFEELVVTQCTLLALKAHASLLPDALSYDESIFRDDSKIWEKDIIDGGVRHKLAIYRDNLTATKRLYAAVTDRNAKPQLECIGDFKLIIYNAVLYTFGDRYLTARHDARRFEINFKYDQDNRQLKYLLDESFKALQSQRE